jgi:hypothetical protein
MTVTDARARVPFDVVRQHIAARFTIAAQGESWVGFRWSVGENKLLRFKIALSSLAGEERLLVMSPAAPERDLLPRQVLAEAATLGPAVVIEEGLYVVRQWIDLRDISGPSLDRAITLVADAVLRIQTHVIRPGAARVSALRPFANFAD